MSAPRLPHHRRYASFHDRREDEAEDAVIHTALAVAYVLGVIALVYLAAFVAGTA